MPRRLRVSSGGFAYHVLNCAVARERIFRRAKDYEAFEKVLARGEGAHAFAGVVRAAEHWHLVLWPPADGDLSEFMRWLSVTHTQRWHAAHPTSGRGALYQGRFKSFPIQEDQHLLTVLRCVERNALCAKLVASAEAWRWCSLWHRLNGVAAGLLDEGPVPLSRNWRRQVPLPQREAELAALRQSVARGRPSARRPGRRKRASDCTWNRRFAHVAARGRLGRPRLPKIFKTPDPFLSSLGKAEDASRRLPRSWMLRACRNVSLATQAIDGGGVQVQIGARGGSSSSGPTPYARAALRQDKSTSSAHSSSSRRSKSFGHLPSAIK